MHRNSKGGGGAVVGVLVILVGAGLLVGGLLSFAERSVDLFGVRSGKAQIRMAELSTYQAGFEAEKAKAEAAPATMREYWGGLVDYVMARGYVDQSMAITESYIRLSEEDMRARDEWRRFAFFVAISAALTGVLATALFWGRRISAALVSLAGAKEIVRRAGAAPPRGPGTSRGSYG